MNPADGITSLSGSSERLIWSRRLGRIRITVFPALSTSHQDALFLSSYDPVRLLTCPGLRLFWHGWRSDTVVNFLPPPQPQRPPGTQSALLFTECFLEVAYECSEEGQRDLCFTIYSKPPTNRPTLTMLFRSSATTVALALTIASLSGSGAAVFCAVCPPTIFYQGLTRTLTLTKYTASAGTVQCNYDTPAIPGKSPGCLYRNLDGQVTFTNTGATLSSLPGACPNPATVITKTTSC
ncbi:hypothetical protein LshimejAT787_0901970 [Lyophyllum shimeji]|uniref:Uncharacterized protein n=1 Tax=Lyophyllum shimeji TaxID=47721 RepID=A0A9P3PTC5_LYOSH|nr:hypothetical protein LshimejAT787_0901970 [Lyophyllum shimeji]